MSSLTSVDDLEQERLSFDVYPNPANEILNVKCEILSEPSKITITNMLGDVVLEETVRNQNASFNIFKFNSGVYFVTLTNQYGKGITKKIVKE